MEHIFNPSLGFEGIKGRRQCLRDDFGGSINLGAHAPKRLLGCL
jgi:hypothetical protein